MSDTKDNQELTEAVGEIKVYIKRTLEMLHSGRVAEARAMLVRLYVGMDDYLPEEKK